jgi:hypothetical protein
VRVRRAGDFLGEREQRITFRATEPPAGVLAEEKHNKGEDQAQADREGEGNNGHDGG